jgi:Asp-tRNA(Asn)/Glu-tRNA(Gln) amidotransferase A subunit family amidase
VGTDTGGSVRIPAALCGIVGYKPTLGTLSTRGVFPLAPTCDHVGLLGEQVDDVLLLADAMDIKVPESDAWLSARLGVIRDIAPVPLSPEIAAAFDGAMKRLAQDFACVNVSTSGLFDAVFGAFASIVLIEGGIEHFRRNDWDRISTRYNPETVDRLKRAETMDLRAYAAAQQTRRSFTTRLHEVMSTVDYLVLPTCPRTASRCRHREHWRLDRHGPRGADDLYGTVQCRGISCHFDSSRDRRTQPSRCIADRCEARRRRCAAADRTADGADAPNGQRPQASIDVNPTTRRQR